VTCTVVQEREQPQLYDVVSRALATGSAFAVLDPTWPPRFRDLAVRQIEAAVAGGMVGVGDMVVFSSGSTARPRGIVRTVQSWQASVAALSDITGITGEDRVWLPGPLWSSLFLYGAFHAGAVGAQLALRGDDPAGATALHCVPTQLPGLLHRALTGGLPLVRVAVVAGEHLAAPLRQQCERAGWRVVEYYGAAELSFVSWRDRRGPFQRFPGVETELRQAVVWVRSPYLARGYLQAHPDGPFRLDQQGWATVNDLAREVAGGLEVLGRGNSAVTSGGHTVVVEEVERLLGGLPGVQDVALLGVPHPRLGQVLTAVVVGWATDASLRAAVAGMPTPSRPRRWVHTDVLPRTSSGKLRRDVLPDLVERLSRP
jgi:long-chain acyl-CoA synthetase